MSLVTRIRGRRGPSGFGHASTADEVTHGLNLRGQTILITGVSSGLGAESARVLHRRGARILGVARSQAAAARACEAWGPDAVPLACDLSEPSSVRACVATIKALGVELDVILCNAGIMALPERELRYGQELQFLTNHIGHFLLVTGLLELLTDRGRVVMLSSAGHELAPYKTGIQLGDLTFERNYQPWAAYGQSKLANLLFARGLARRFSGSQRTANALHPGVISTALARHMGPLMKIGGPLVSRLFFKNVGQGAATQCYLAVHPGVAGISGEYFADCNIAKPSRFGRDDQLAQRLWETTERIVAELPGR
jgi:NAD(P)-dependent dehydrogenase (short-subunit alcohol dehydrogenase family)